MLVDTAPKLVVPGQNSSAPVTPAPQPSPSNTVAVDHPNPQYQLNAEMGIVVIQFRNESGKVDLSIPSQAQLDAYAANPFGSPPAAVTPIEA